MKWTLRQNGEKMVNVRVTFAIGQHDFINVIVILLGQGIRKFDKAFIQEEMRKYLKEYGQSGLLSEAEEYNDACEEMELFNKAQEIFYKHFN